MHVQKVSYSHRKSYTPIPRVNPEISDLELGLRPFPNLPSGHSADLLAPGVALSLQDFAHRLKSGSSSSTIGQLEIQRVELRKSRRLPFRHEYVLVFVEIQECMHVIRLDR